MPALGDTLWQRGERLWIVGASVRAASASAVRSGLRITAADLFCDQDLLALVPDGRAWQLSSLSTLSSCREIHGRGPWMYCGGLENRPRLVQALSRRRPLWGTGADALRQVRNPRRLQQACWDAGLAYPDWAWPEGAPPPRGWLVKPIRSGGGRGVRFARPPDAGRRRRNVYFQEFIDGPSYSAVYLACQGTAQLIGISRQILRRDLPAQTTSPAGMSTDRHPFQYVGSYIGPWSTDERQPWWNRWQEIGDRLAKSFELVGLFGVDAVISPAADGSDCIVLIEVNPRYTASVELFERAGVLSAVEAHGHVCYYGDYPEIARTPVRRWLGKRILYAESALHITGDVRSQLAPDVVELADIPRPGQVIACGQPLATSLVAAETERDLRRRMALDEPEVI